MIAYATADSISVPSLDREIKRRLYRKLHIVLSQEVQQPLVSETQRRPGPKDLPYGIPAEEWPTVLQRVLENHESYRKVAYEYSVSRETIRRLVRAARCGSQACF
jgi:response regulator of citrate/malate metabolism